MKKLFILAALTISTLSFANTVEQTVNQIESENEAQCIEIKNSMNLCLNYVCFGSKTYRCTNTDSVFDVKLKLKRTTLATGEVVVKVRKVKYLN